MLLTVLLRARKGHGAKVSKRFEKVGFLVFQRCGNALFRPERSDRVRNRRFEGWLRKELKAPKWVNFRIRAEGALSRGTDFGLDLLLGTPDLPRPRVFISFLHRAH